MKAEDKARIESLKNWAQNDPNYQFLLALVEEQDEVIQECLDVLANIAEIADSYVGQRKDDS